MLAQRLRHWPNIKTTLFQHVVFRWESLVVGRDIYTSIRIQTSNDRQQFLASMSNISKMSLRRRIQKRELPSEIATLPAKKRRTAVSIQQKREMCIYKQKNPDATRREIMQYMMDTRGIHLGFTTITDVLRDREKWMSVDESKAMVSYLHHAHWLELEEELYSYVVEARNRGEELEDDVLVKKAKDIGRQMVGKRLKYTRGWLKRFKEGHGIGSPPKEKTITSSDDLRDMKDDLSSFAPDDTYTMAETALFYSIGPAATRPVIDSNHHKLTLVLCGNATGTHKLKPFVIGKQPGDKTLNSSTGVTYHYNDKVLMNQVLFQLWLQDLDIQMCLAKRNICLLLDESSVRSIDGINLCNVRVKFFKHVKTNPSSCNSPMAAGIIKAFKLYYRKQLVHHFLQDTNPQIISIKEALGFINQAWVNVTAANIQQFWQNVGILSETFNKARVTHLTAQTNNLSELQKLIDRLCQNPNTLLSAEQYIDIDSYKLTSDVEKDHDGTVAELVPVENTNIKKETDDNGNGNKSHRETLAQSRLRPVSRLNGYIERNIKKEPIYTDLTDSHDNIHQYNYFNPQDNNEESTLNVNTGKHSESLTCNSFLQSQSVETCVLISPQAARTSLCTVIRYLQENQELSHLIDSTLNTQAAIVKTQH